VDGINEVLVTWPTGELSSELVLTQAADDLIGRRLPNLFRVFGEIHTFSVFDPSGSSVEVQSMVPTRQSASAGHTYGRQA
jgi:hypothetical protein